MLKVVLLGPCTIGNYLVVGDYDWYTSGIMQYRKLGINAINGEEWDESGLQTICSELGDLKCIEAKTYTLEAVSVKSKEHFVQNAIVGRF